jgi:hypothetical protein
MYFQAVTTGPDARGAIRANGLTSLTIGALIACIFFLGIDPKPIFGSIDPGEGTGPGSLALPVASSSAH